MRRRLVAETLERRLVLASITGDHVDMEFDSSDEPMDKTPLMVSLEAPAELRDHDETRVHDETHDHDDDHDDYERPDRPIIAANHFVAVLRTNTSQDVPALSANAVKVVDEVDEVGEADETDQVDDDPTFRPIRTPHGVARMHLREEGSELFFEVKLNRVPGIQAAHIHLNAVDGPVAVVLLSLDGAGARLNDITFRGSVGEDDILADEDSGFDGTMDSLVQAMRDGNAYINVHTLDQPDGAVDGQIRGLGMRPRHNPVNRMDVDGDNEVTPGDAVTLVNEINEHGSHYVQLPTRADFVAPYYDTSGDNIVSPTDLLHIINYLNEKVQQAGIELPDISPEEISETVKELAAALNIEDLNLPVDLDELKDFFGDHDRVEEVLSGLEGQFDEVYSELVRVGEELVEEHYDEFRDAADKIVDELEAGYEKYADEFESLAGQLKRRLRWI